MQCRAAIDGADPEILAGEIVGEQLVAVLPRRKRPV
jgi:hypothetical protein